MEGNQNTRPPLTTKLSDLFANVNANQELKAPKSRCHSEEVAHYFRGNPPVLREIPSIWSEKVRGLHSRVFPSVTTPGCGLVRNDTHSLHFFGYYQHLSPFQLLIRIVNLNDESFLKYYFTPIVKVEGARNRPHNPPVPIVDQIPNAVNP